MGGSDVLATALAVRALKWYPPSGIDCDRTFDDDGNDRAVSLTTSFINAARFVAVMVTGAAAAPAIERLAETPAECADMPIRGIVPISGELKWYLDGSASGGTRDTGANG